MDDLVSRQAVKDGMHKYGFLAPDMTVNEFVEDCLPAIDPVKHGKWINDNGLYRCSVCKEFTITGWAVGIPIKQMYKAMKYCNNCGARMDDEVNV